MSDPNIRLRNNKIFLRISFAVTGILILGFIYLFQRVNFLQGVCDLLKIQSANLHPYWFFIVNKTFRLIVNDLACFMIIFALFQERKHLKIAWYFFLFEILVLLPVYFILKLNLEGDSEISSPLLSQIHRMIVNPMLMILLMVGFFYQKLKQRVR